ncbi:hypothetical protein ACOMHN_033838 [Nucella lapillus]
MSPETALELLDCSYSDLQVRAFAVKSLDKGLTDDKLAHLILEAFCRGCGHYLKVLSQQVEALDKLTKLTDTLKAEVTSDDHMRFLQEQLQQPDYQEALCNLTSPLNPSQTLGKLRQADCQVMSSKKLPLWLVWDNPDIMADIGECQYFIMFKNGDALLMFIIQQLDSQEKEMTVTVCESTVLLQYAAGVSQNASIVSPKGLWYVL